MFTGLIKEQGKIVKIIKSSHSIKLTIQASKNLLETYKIGDSMAVNGVCLTCVQKSSSQFTENDKIRMYSFDKIKMYK